MRTIALSILFILGIYANCISFMLYKAKQENKSVSDEIIIFPSKVFNEDDSFKEHGGISFYPNFYSTSIDGGIEKHFYRVKGAHIFTRVWRKEIIEKFTMINKEEK